MNKIILLNFLLSSLLVVLVEPHLLPDELLTDDAEQLEREKRDGFFERLFKTFPLFKHDNDEEETATPDEEEKSEKVQDVINDDDVAASFEGYRIPEFEIPLGADISATPSLMQDSTTRSENVSTFETATPMTSSMLVVVPTSSIQVASVGLSLSNSSVSSTINSSSAIQLLSTTPTYTQTVSVHTSVPKPTVSLDIQPTPSQSVQLSTSYGDPIVNGPIYDMKLLLSPKLPDERGYADVSGNT